MVLQQLQGTLDFERGGSAAKQFEQFYNLVRAKLLEAQMRGSADLMQQQIRYMSEVRDCWVQARRMLEPRPGAVTPAAGRLSRGGRIEQMERIDQHDRLQLLRRANERFGRFFARFSGAPVLGTA